MIPTLNAWNGLVWSTISIATIIGDQYLLQALFRRLVLIVREKATAGKDIGLSDGEVEVICH
jgi:hypothetical protein